MFEDQQVGSALEIDPPEPEFLEHLREAKECHALVASPRVLDGPRHVITGGRQEGKTRLALKWLTEATDGVERVLVVRDERMAMHMRMDQGWAPDDGRIVGYRRLMRGGSKRGVEYGIDESMSILADVLGLRDTPRLVTIGVAEPWQTGK